MIDKNISVSEQVANLSKEAQLVFTWSIPHADDVGVLPRSHRTLKALIVPMWDCLLEDFDKFVKEITEQGLWREIEHGGQTFYAITKFRDHQTLKKDRQPQTKLDIIFDKDPKVTWQTLEDIMEALGFQMEDNGFQLDTEEKRREEKRSEKKRKSTRTETKIEKKEVESNFDTFWETYPRKVSKKKAQQTWSKIAPTGELFQAIIQGLEKAKRSPQWTKDGGQYIPHPTTWLNQERWTDEDTTAPARRVDKV